MQGWIARPAGARWAEHNAEQTGKPQRRFADFRWTTKDSWRRRRRVVAKAEWMPNRGDNGANPRFVATSLKASEHEAQKLYEQLYCARGEIENRSKECQPDLFADWTSAKTMRANQLRLWLASMAHVLLAALRRIGLAHTELAVATCGTIRLRLLKIGALVTIKRPPHQDCHVIRLPRCRRVPPRLSPIIPLTAPRCRPVRQQRRTRTSNDPAPTSPPLGSPVHPMVAINARRAAKNTVTRRAGEKCGLGPSPHPRRHSASAPSPPSSGLPRSAGSAPRSNPALAALESLAHNPSFASWQKTAPAHRETKELCATALCGGPWVGGSSRRDRLCH